MRAVILAALACWPMSAGADNTMPGSAARVRLPCVDAVPELTRRLKALDPKLEVLTPVPAAGIELVARDSGDVTWRVMISPLAMVANPNMTRQLYERSFVDHPIADRDQNPLIINRSRQGRGIELRIDATHGKLPESRSPALSPRVRRLLETIEETFTACQGLPEAPRTLARCAGAVDRTLAAHVRQPLFSRGWVFWMDTTGFSAQVGEPPFEVEVFAVPVVLSNPAHQWREDPIINKEISLDKVRLSVCYQLRTHDPDVPLGFVGARIVAQGPADEPRAPPVPPRLRPLVEELKHTLDRCLGGG